MSLRGHYLIQLDLLEGDRLTEVSRPLSRSVR